MAWTILFILWCIKYTFFINASYSENIVASYCHCSSYSQKKRAVHGMEARGDQFSPVGALLARESNTVFCGAVVITPRHVITGGRCSDSRRPQDIIFVLGAHIFSGSISPGNFIAVSKIITHPMYDTISETNDIAILLLASEVTFSYGMGPVCLPEKKLNLTGERITVLGWGWTEHGTMMRYVNMSVIEHSSCAPFYGLQEDPQVQLCTNVLSEDSPICQKDSSDSFWPQVLVWSDPQNGRNTLVGLVSYGLDCSSPLPGVSTAVSAYLDWIKEAINGSGVTSSICQIQ